MRRGFSLVELVVAMAIGGILAAALFGLLVAQLRIARETARRTTASDAVRVTSHVLGGEARRMAPRDLRAIARDSISIRAFRGAAIACARDGVSLGVRYRGDRAPDPAKDSVLVMAPLAVERSARLVDARAVAGPGPAAPDHCAVRPGETLMWWTFEPAVDTASLLLLFENGSYYLTAGALRYRLGAEGRQPVSTELFLHPQTRFGILSHDAFGVSLATEPDRLLGITVRFGIVAE
jgi:prepilin-type N-terminal cleavage/methylation domain-containing protein